VVVVTDEKEALSLSFFSKAVSSRESEASSSVKIKYSAKLSPLPFFLPM